MKIKDMNKEQYKKYINEKVRKWRKNNRERDLELKKKWRDENKEHRKKYDKEYQIEHRKELNKYRREYQRKNPIKYKQKKEYIRDYMKKYMENEDNHKKSLIRQRDYQKLRKKLIELHKCCQKCSSTEFLEMHHEDYFTEGAVLILCRKCHRQLHRKD